MKIIDSTTKINRRKDYVEPFYIGNFCNCISSIAKELMPDVSSTLKELGWDKEFIIYYFSDKQFVRLYLRIAYVSTYFLDGTWEEIKTRLPKIIPLLKSVVDLRKEKDGELLWIEKNVKDLHWVKLDAPCIFCDTYRTDNNLLNLQYNTLPI